MPRMHRSRTSAAGAAMILALLALTLAACGSGGKSSSPAATSANAATTTTGAPSPSGTSTTPSKTAPGKTTPSKITTAPSVSPATKELAAGVEQLRSCLATYGVPLPKGVKPGQAGGLFGNGNGLPKGVTLAQAEAALKKCAGASSTAKPSPLAGKALKGLVGGKALSKGLDKLFACLRQQGVKLAEGSGSSLAGLANLNLKNPKVKAALETCRGQVKKK